jgi:hypothetical protein
MCDSIVTPPRDMNDPNQQEIWLKQVEKQSEKTRSCIENLTKMSICNDECQKNKLSSECAKCAQKNGCLLAESVSECDSCILNYSELGSKCTNCNRIRKPLSLNTKIFIFLFSFLSMVLIFRMLIQ